MMIVLPIILSFSYNQPPSALEELSSKPEILHIPFNTPPSTLPPFLSRIGLPKESEKIHEYKSFLTITYAGIPQEIDVQDGITKLFFYKNKLYKILLSFSPSYENYLIVKNQLTKALNTRFSIQKKAECIDPILQTKLSFLKPGEYNRTIEDEIAQSLCSGKTFFSYSLEDSMNTFDIDYTLSANKKNNAIEPVLLLSYSLIEIQNTVEEHLEGKSTDVISSTKILPH